MSDAQGEVRLWNGGKVPAEDDEIVKSSGLENPYLRAVRAAVAGLLPSPEERAFSLQDDENIVKIMINRPRV
ncbi:hypothetical protein [Nevskia sp.]|uniref:hypothetical protein n=1 Tax=Nevskia sp. TaxID=1929292 RepID=UPI003F6F09C5